MNTSQISSHTADGPMLQTLQSPADRASLWGVGYALVAYAAFQACFAFYFVGFLNNVLVPKGVDDGSVVGTASAVAINLGLIVMWGVQHSVMARPAFKRIWTRVIPAHTERATYVLASSVALAAVMWGWVPMPGVVWHVDGELARFAVWGLAAAGWSLLLAASFEIDHFELFGLKQPWHAARGKAVEEPGFQARRIYRVVRHPIQTGILVGMWATPDMSVGHLLFAALMTLYIFVGLYFEERGLVRRFGDQYREYRRQVAMLVPFSRYL